MTHLQKALIYYHTNYPNWSTNDKLATITQIHTIGRRSTDLRGLGLVEKMESKQKDSLGRKTTITYYRCTEKGMNIDVSTVHIPYGINKRKSKSPRPSLEESIIKKENKQLNDEYTPSLLVRLKSFLFSNS